MKNLFKYDTHLSKEIADIRRLLTSTKKVVSNGNTLGTSGVNKPVPTSIETVGNIGSIVQKKIDDTISSIDLVGGGFLYRGEFSLTTKYYHTELRRDIVLGTDGNYWITNKLTLNGKEGSYWKDPVGDPNNWERFEGEFSSIATGLLLTADANITRTLTIGSDVTNGIIQSSESLTAPNNQGTYIFEGDGFFFGENQVDSKAVMRIGTVDASGSLTDGFMWDKTNGAQFAGDISATGKITAGITVLGEGVTPGWNGILIDATLNNYWIINSSSEVLLKIGGSNGIIYDSTASVPIRMGSDVGYSTVIKMYSGSNWVSLGNAGLNTIHLKSKGGTQLQLASGNTSGDNFALRSSGAGTGLEFDDGIYNTFYRKHTINVDDSLGNTIFALDSSGNITAVNNITSIGNATAVNYLGTSVDVTGVIEGNSFNINGVEVISSRRNAVFNSLDIDGVAGIDSIGIISGLSLDINSQASISSAGAISGVSLNINSVATINSSGVADLTSLAIGGTSTITSGRVGNFASVSVGGTTMLNSSQQIARHVMASVTHTTGTTVNVSGVGYVKFNLGSNTTITNFTNGVDGQVIFITKTSGAIPTIQDGTNIFLNGSANYSMTTQSTLTLIYDGTSWYELARSVN